MVFSPDADSDIMLGTAAPSKHTSFDDELIGGSADEESKDDSNSQVINEDLGSLHDLLSQVEKNEGSDSEQ
jgi:DNA-directed RNA polymerase subunit beta'